MSDVDALITNTIFWHPEFFVDSAWTEHAPFSYWLEERLKPSLIVELGTHNGMSFFSFCQAVERLQLETRLIAIDTWQGDQHAGFFDEQVFDEFKKNQKRYDDISWYYRKTFEEGLKHIENDSADIIHIDGFHSYEAVRKDFYDALPKLAKNGIIILHDTNEYGRNFGIYRFWAELVEKFPTFHFNHGHGLGLVSPKEIRKDLDFIFSLNFKDMNKLNWIRNLFMSHGNQIVISQQIENATKEIKENESIKYQNAHLNNKINELNNIVLDLQKNILELTLSTSWKVTRPLRFFGKLIKVNEFKL